MTVLIADIGGTNTRLALSENGQLLPDTLRSYKNRGFDSLSALMAHDRARHDYTVDVAVFDIAGIVHDGCCDPVNLDWVVCEDDIARASGAAQAHLFNDLQAHGYGLTQASDDMITPIFTGSHPDATGARVMLAPGTGFNAVPVHQTPFGIFVPPAEAGHACLPGMRVMTPELRAYLAREGHCSVEDVVRGPALAKLDQHFSGSARSTFEIIEAVKTGDAAANEAMRIFCQAFGAVAGDLALIHLAHGGMYISGGLGRAIAPFLDSHGFYEAFLNKGPMRWFTERLSVSLIQDEHAALRGCAVYAELIAPR